MSEFDRNLPLGGQNVRHLVSVVGALPILDCDFGDPSEGFLRRTGIHVALAAFNVLPFLGIIVLVWIVASPARDASRFRSRRERATLLRIMIQVEAVTKTYRRVHHEVRSGPADAPCRS